jgi:hypothetical protein
VRANTIQDSDGAADCKVVGKAYFGLCVVALGEDALEDDDMEVEVGK